MKNNNGLLNNIVRIHSTKLGIMRIKKNLVLETQDVVKWCKQKIKQTNDIKKTNGFQGSIRSFVTLTSQMLGDAERTPAVQQDIIVL